jgi:hypothetical protein
MPPPLGPILLMLSWCRRYWVPEACVSRLAPSPLHSVAMHPTLPGQLIMGVVPDLPPKVAAAVKAQLAHSTPAQREEVRAVTEPVGVLSRAYRAWGNGGCVVERGG